MKQRSFVYIVLVTALVLRSMGSGFGQAAKDPEFNTRVVEQIKSQIPGWFKETDVPGLAVAVVDDEKILWQHVEGVAARGTDQPIEPETLFSIQSMSKSFTALGVLMAVQEGLLDLDVPITAYLPDFTVNSIYEKFPERKMTLCHLLSHKAGFTHEAPLGGNYHCRPHTFEEHVLSIMDSWLRYPVGYRYAYSNLGIDLAGFILQKVSGTLFWDYIKAKVFEPIGMVSSSMDFAEIKGKTNRALGHVSPRLTVPDGIPVDIPMIPAGGVYTNILDMAEYRLFHINKGMVDGKQIIRRDLIEQMHTVQFPEFREKAGYGLCLVKSFAGPTYYLTHGGGGYGFISSMTMFPDLKLGVVTLTNANESRVHAGRIIEIVQTMIEEKYGPTQVLDKAFDTKTCHPVSEPGEQFDRIRGTYEGNNLIGEKDGVFGIRMGRDFYPLTMYRGTEGLVGIFGINSEMRFKPDLKGRPGSLVVLNRATGASSVYDYHKPGTSMDPRGPDKSEWASYIGNYRYLSWGRMSGPTGRVWVSNGHLSFNGIRCFEHLPGLFFTYSGEALDFRGTIPTYRNIMIFRKEGHWR